MEPELCHRGGMKKPAKIISLHQPDTSQTAKSVLDQALAKVEDRKKRCGAKAEGIEKGSAGSR